MWKTYHPFSAAAMSRVSSKKDPNALSLRDIQIDSFFTTTRKCFLQINLQLINLDYDHMKNFTYILISCKCFQIVSKRKDWKAFIYVRLSHLHCFVVTPQKCYMRINKQLINLVYNDNIMMNLTYSLLCFNVVKNVFWNIDRKALSVWDIHID